jgi:F-type H+-transporting ATPase subunit b
MMGLLAMAADAAHGAPVDGFTRWLTDPYTWTTTALLIFFGILGYFGVHKTILAVLDKRAADIQAELSRARELREEAERMRLDAERLEREAASQAEALLTQARAEAKLLVSNAQAELTARLARREAQATARIARAEADAAREVRVVATDAAAAIAERLLTDAAAKGDGNLAGAISEVQAALSQR